MSELMGARARVAELEETVSFVRSEASRASTLAADTHRRETAEAARWAAQLESKLELMSASLSIERADNSRLEEELDASKRALAEAEDRARRGSRAGALGSGARAAAGTKSGEVSFAVAPLTSGASAKAAAPPDLLLVGTPARPDEVALRKSPARATVSGGTAGGGAFTSSCSAQVPVARGEVFSGAGVVATSGPQPARPRTPTARAAGGPGLV